MQTSINPDLRAAALKMVRENHEADPLLEEAYLFPANEEIRLVYIDPNTLPQRAAEFVKPFYFGRDLQSGLLFRSAIALIRPEERYSLLPPEDWGTWNDAEVIRV